MLKILNVSKNSSVRIAVLVCTVLVVSAAALGQQLTTQERVAAFKQSLAKSQTELRKYQWVETTTVTYKGDVKSVKKNTCYYGADGKIQKVPIAEPAPEQAQSGGRGGRLKKKIAANKKEEMTDYMQRAVLLVGHYAPPDPDLVKYSKETDNIKVEPVEPNKVIRLSLPNFYQKGDLLSATLNIAANTIVDVNVSTWLESDKDAVTLKIIFSQLNDGTSYASRTVLDAKAQKIVVTVENSGHRPL